MKKQTLYVDVISYLIFLFQNSIFYEVWQDTPFLLVLFLNWNGLNPDTFVESPSHVFVKNALWHQGSSIFGETKYTLPTHTLIFIFGGNTALPELLGVQLANVNKVEMPQWFTPAGKKRDLR